MSIASEKPIAVLGAGAWGTALAILFSHNRHKTLLWGHDPRHIQALLDTHSNEESLPGIPFPESLQPVTSLEQAIRHCGDILIAVPSHAFHSVLEQISPLLEREQRILWATKGLEKDTGKLLHENFESVLGAQRPYAVLSGPTFAAEVARGLPTAVTIASNDQSFADELAQRIHNDCFRAYTSNDVVGVELGGAVKNVMAIAAGIADGLGFGANTRAALITRGLAEIMRLGTAMGGQQETFMGLAGLGDLVLTCTDNQSRNRRYGLARAQGLDHLAALDSITQVVEGIQTAREVLRVAEQHRIDMPITRQIYRVLYEDVDPREAVHDLFARELKPEFQ